MPTPRNVQESLLTQEAEWDAHLSPRMDGPSTIKANFTSSVGQHIASMHELIIQEYELATIRSQAFLRKILEENSDYRKRLGLATGSAQGGHVVNDSFHWKKAPSSSVALRSNSRKVDLPSRLNFDVYDPRPETDEDVIKPIGRSNSFVMHNLMSGAAMRAKEDLSQRSKTRSKGSSGINANRGNNARVDEGELQEAHSKQQEHMSAADMVKIRSNESSTSSSGHNCRGKAQRMVQSAAFDTASAALVLLNAITIGMQADHMAQELSEAAPFGYRFIEFSFCLIFLSELILRLLAFGSKFLFGIDWKWNLFDLLLVGLQVTDEFLSFIASGKSASEGRLNFSFMRVLRILRLVRILRIIRILRLIGELRAIVSSILGSLKSLMWTTMLLFVVVYVFAVYFTQIVLDYRVANLENIDNSQQEELVYFFGSLSRSILSLYQAISGGIDWETLAQPLMGRISTLLGVVLSGYTAFCLLALMNVVTGVFVESALETAKDDRKSYMLRYVKELFAKADPDNTGSLDWDTFEMNLEEKFMQDFFKTIDVDVSEAKSVFCLLDADDSGEIDIDEFLNGCLSLHGPAKAVHLATLMYESRMITRHQESQLEFIQHSLQQIMGAMPALADRALSMPMMGAELGRRRSFQKNMTDDEWRANLEKAGLNSELQSSKTAP